MIINITNISYMAGGNRYKYYHHFPLHHGVDDIEFITITATGSYKQNSQI